MARKAPAANAAYQQLKSDLKAGTLGTCYLLYGEEAYLREYYLGRMRRALLDGPAAAFNDHRFRREDLDWDAVAEAVETIKHNPDSRRIIVSSWNVADLDNMNLPPCHAFFQFYVANGRLSLQLYQRSADIFLGVPFNIASYALLLQMMAQVTGLKAGDFVHTLGDAHIYTNHLEQVHLQLTREPRALPQMILNPEVKSIFDFKYEDFTLVGYDPYPHIKGVVSV